MLTAKSAWAATAQIANATLAALPKNPHQSEFKLTQ